MLVDTSFILKNADGTPAKDGDQVATVQKALENALVTDPKELTSAQKVARYKLFQKISGNSVVDLSIDELATAKTAVEIYPTLVYGQVLAYLEQ